MKCNVIIKCVLLAAILIIGAGSARAESTEQNRDESLILVGIAPVGIHIPTLITHPVTVGIYLGESLLLGVEGGTFSFSDEDVDSDSDESYIGDFTNIGAYARWFPGTNSFNVLLAVHNRQWSVTYDADFLPDSGPRIPLRSKLSTEATVATVGFGNQWIMDFGLVLAMDWVLLSGNVSESHTVEVISDTGPLNASELARYDQDIQEAADFLNDLSGFPGIFVFSLGWAF